MGNQNARWSEASDVIPMFPTLVWKIELEAELREAIGVRGARSVRTPEAGLAAAGAGPRVAVGSVTA